MDKNTAHKPPEVCSKDNANDCKDELMHYNFIWASRLYQNFENLINGSWLMIVNLELWRVKSRWLLSWVRNNLICMNRTSYLIAKYAIQWDIYRLQYHENVNAASVRTTSFFFFFAMISTSQISHGELQSQFNDVGTRKFVYGQGALKNVLETSDKYARSYEGKKSNRTIIPSLLSANCFSTRKGDTPSRLSSRCPIWISSVSLSLCF